MFCPCQHDSFHSDNKWHPRILQYVSIGKYAENWLKCIQANTSFGNIFKVSQKKLHAIQLLKLLDKMQNMKWIQLELLELQSGHGVRYGRTDGQTDGRSETNIPPNNFIFFFFWGGGGGGGGGIHMKISHYMFTYYTQYAGIWTDGDLVHRHINLFRHLATLTPLWQMPER